MIIAGNKNKGSLDKLLHLIFGSKMLDTVYQFIMHCLMP